jgi:hypothetical protein
MEGLDPLEPDERAIETDDLAEIDIDSTAPYTLMDDAPAADADRHPAGRKKMNLLGDSTSRHQCALCGTTRDGDKMKRPHGRRKNWECAVRCQ